MATCSVLYLTVVTIAFAGLSRAQDPCLPANHISLINETFRSAGHNLSYNSSVGDGDFNTSVWLRFISPSGGDLVTWPPPIGACGTWFPVWMDGTLPSVSEGVVPRTVYAHWFGGHKDRPRIASVLNCGTFRVYRLPSTTGNGMGYCVGNETRCSPGQTSPTGWTPGCHPIPTTTKDPLPVTTAETQAPPPVTIAQTQATQATSNKTRCPPGKSYPTPGCYPSPPQVVQNQPLTKEPGNPGIRNLEVMIIGATGGLLLAISVGAIIYRKRRRNSRKPDEGPTYDDGDYDTMGVPHQIQKNTAGGGNKDNHLDYANPAYGPDQAHENLDADYWFGARITGNKAYEHKVPGMRNEGYVSNDKRPSSGSVDEGYGEEHQNKYRGRQLPLPNTYTGLDRKGMKDREYCAFPGPHGGVKCML